MYMYNIYILIWSHVSSDSCLIIYVNIYVYIYIHIYMYIYMSVGSRERKWSERTETDPAMGWLRVVGSLKL